MKIKFEFEILRQQYLAFVQLMDLLRYGFYSESLELGPFDDKVFKKGFWVKGKPELVIKLVLDFEKKLKKQKYKKTVEEK